VAGGAGGASLVLVDLVDVVLLEQPVRATPATNINPNNIANFFIILLMVQFYL